MSRHKNLKKHPEKIRSPIHKKLAILKALKKATNPTEMIKSYEETKV